MTTALLLFAALATMAPSASAAPCPTGPIVQRVTCLVETVCPDVDSCGSTSPCVNVTGDTYACADQCVVQDGTANVCYQGECGTGAVVMVHNTGRESCVTECEGTETGVEVTLNDNPTCYNEEDVPPVPDQILASCEGSADYGEVVLGVSACFHPCSGSYGLVLNGDPECHSVVVCPTGSYGVQVDGSGCHTLTSCPSGKVGYRVDGNSATCVTVPTPPTVAPCPSGSGYGVVINGDESCYSPAVCPSGSYGVMVNGDDSGCHTVSICTGSTLGVRLDGTAYCVPSPVIITSCPNGRTGYVVNGQEVCPIP